MQCDIGVVGLGVMGANLALNMERNGFHIAGYDLEAAKGQAFVAGPAAGRHVELAPSPEALMAMLKRPRRVLMMVPAGAAVDSAIAHLKPHLQPGDILIDGGNSWFLDTERRSKELAGGGFHYVGTGVSGGEQGALWGPAIMPGGQREAWEALAPILRAIAAKADDGEPCVDYMGPGGAGHYVKMVHNGIEYGDMQLIAEAYDLLSRGLKLPAKELSAIFEEWNAGDLRSYLVEITAEVLARTDPETGRPLVDLILDEAQQKGTGKWTSQHAFDIGAPIPTINAAVESRILSSLKAERVHASRILHGPSPHYHGKKERLVEAVRAALYASKVTSYAQGFGLLKLASAEYQVRPPGRRHRAHLARGLHHPRLAPRRHHGGVPARRGAAEPPARRRVPAGRREPPGLVAVRRPGRRRDGDPGAGDERVTGVLRRVPQRTAAGQSDTGAARLLRRAHVPARRQARRVPHRVVAADVHGSGR